MSKPIFNRQAVLEKVVAHLLAQRVPAVSATVFGGCRYRSPNGTKCAVGCLIPDELYTPEIEGAGVEALIFGKSGGTGYGDSLFEFQFVKNADGHLNLDDPGFLEELQWMHDEHARGPKVFTKQSILEQLDIQRVFDKNYGVVIPDSLKD